MANIPIYIPTFISDAGYNPSKVLPHLYFYNNTLTSSQYYLQGFYDPSDPYLGLDTPPVTKFPYFDNYNVEQVHFLLQVQNHYYFIMKKQFMVHHQLHRFIVNIGVTILS